MKRFEIGPYTVTKDDRPVCFPEILNMEPYCTTECVQVIIDNTYGFIITVSNINLAFFI